MDWSPTVQRTSPKRKFEEVKRDMQQQQPYMWESDYRREQRAQARKIALPSNAATMTAQNVSSWLCGYQQH
jgi:hypothetical protein